MNALVRMPSSATPLAMSVNGRPVEALVEPRTHLADFLRDGLNLTGTHLGCEHGVCGACTVLIDGEPARACLNFAACCDGADITTIEGLDDDAIAAELRAAFNREHALQCGFCTPGILVAARDLVLRLDEADEHQIRLGLSGNLCRCTGYVGIVRAVTAVIAGRRTRGIAALARTDRALGPVGAHAGRVRSAAIAAPVAIAASPVAVGLSGDFIPAHSFTQEFAVSFPPDAVFAFFDQVEEVAACLPGAFVSAKPAPDRLEGGMRISLGPIAATFRGRATIERDEENRQGRIRGAGIDGRSTTEGEIRYRVVAGDAPGVSRVELAIGYSLKGPLAQFGRPGLVRDLAARLVADFSKNLEARLAGSPATVATASGLNPIRLLAGLISDRFAAWLRRARPKGGASENKS